MKGLEMKKLAAIILGGVLFVGCGNDPDDPPVNTEALGACPGAQNWEMWVPRQMANDIKIVKGPEFAIDSRTIDLSMTGLKNPHGVTFNKAQDRAIVAMLGTPEATYADGGVVIINASDYSIIGQVVTNAKTHQVVFSPSGEIWAINVNAPGTVTFIDAASMTVTGTPLAVGGQAVAIRFTSDGTKAFLTNQEVMGENSWVNVINVGGKSLDGEAYKTGKVTVTPILTSDGKSLFVTNHMSNSVSKIDVLATDRTAAVKEFATGIQEAHAVALGKDHVFVTARMGSRVVALNRDGSVAKDIAVTAAAGNPIPDMIAMSPNCAKAYVTERADGKLLQIDVETLAVTGSVDLGGGYTHGVAVHTLPGDM
jgi:DNA-binding beta-propeller fold protein YncE